MSLLFERFNSELASLGGNERFRIGTDDGVSVYYIPFEASNPHAKLVLVGITPGPKQMACAYGEARDLLRSDYEKDELLQRVKRKCAFCGMRPKINEMMDHFGIPKAIGFDSAADLWTTAYDLFEPTSVVPNAAFKGDKYFNGPFKDILINKLLRAEFENNFIPSLEAGRMDRRFIGMGPVADEALAWCAKEGIINSSQILGYFPHASGQSGSQFNYFLRRKRLEDLNPRDPVRNRAEQLDEAYTKMKTNVDAWMRCEILA